MMKKFLVCLTAILMAIGLTAAAPISSVSYTDLNFPAVNADMQVFGKITTSTVNISLESVQGGVNLTLTVAGPFVTFAGASPAGTGTVSAGITGTYTEEYTAFLPGSATIGNLEGDGQTFDFQCQDRNCWDNFPIDIWNSIPYVENTGGYWQSVEITDTYTTPCNGTYTIYSYTTLNNTGYPDAGYPTETGDITDKNTCSTSKLTKGWTPTGRIFWRLSTDNPTGIQKCIIWTNGEFPSVESQTRLCGENWNTTQNHAFQEFTNGEGAIIFFDTWDLVWGNPNQLAP